MENLTLGAYAWDRDEWEEVFYPEDLPEDWRLDFYSNEFHCALVPQSVWVEWTEDDFEDLLESVEGQRFALYLSLDSALTAKEEKQLLLCHQRFYAYKKGVVFWQESFRLPSGCDEFSQTLVKPVDGKEVNVDGVWSWTHSGWQMSGDPLGILLDVPSNGRVQADILKSFVASLPSQYSAVPFILGDVNKELDIEDLRSFKAIAELLGY